MLFLYAFVGLMYESLQILPKVLFDDGVVVITEKVMKGLCIEKWSNYDYRFVSD